MTKLFFKDCFSHLWLCAFVIRMQSLLILCASPNTTINHYWKRLKPKRKSLKSLFEKLYVSTAATAQNIKIISAIKAHILIDKLEKYNQNKILKFQYFKNIELKSYVVVVEHYLWHMHKTSHKQEQSRTHFQPRMLL